MAIDVRSPHLPRLLLRLPLLLLSRLLSLLRCPRHLRPPSLVALRDLHLSLSFIRAGLVPVTLDLDPATSVHLWVPAHRRHDRPALVLIHGFGGNSKWQWERQVSPLCQSFDLYVPDLVFFGRSQSTKPDRSVEFQALSIAEAMRRLGVDRYSLCGISYGGFVAYRLAAAVAEKGVVERVVILSAGVCTTAEQRAEMVDREERDVCDVLLPRRPEDLMTLMRRSMSRPPRWMPTFLLADFIQVMYEVHRTERLEMLQELLSRGTGMEPLPVLAQVPTHSCLHKHGIGSELFLVVIKGDAEDAICVCAVLLFISCFQSGNFAHLGRPRRCLPAMSCPSITKPLGCEVEAGDCKECRACPTTGELSAC